MPDLKPSQILPILEKFGLSYKTIKEEFDFNTLVTMAKRLGSPTLNKLLEGLKKVNEKEREKDPLYPSLVDLQKVALIEQLNIIAAIENLIKKQLEEATLLGHQEKSTDLMEEFPAGMTEEEQLAKQKQEQERQKQLEELLSEPEQALSKAKEEVYLASIRGNQTLQTQFQEQRQNLIGKIKALSTEFAPSSQSLATALDNIVKEAKERNDERKEQEERNKAYQIKTNAQAQINQLNNENTVTSLTPAANTAILGTHPTPSASAVPTPPPIPAVALKSPQLQIAVMKKTLFEELYLYKIIMDLKRLLQENKEFQTNPEVAKALKENPELREKLQGRIQEFITTLNQGKQVAFQEINTTQKKALDTLYNLQNKIAAFDEKKQQPAAKIPQQTPATTPTLQRGNQATATRQTEEEKEKEKQKQQGKSPFRTKPVPPSVSG